MNDRSIKISKPSYAYLTKEAKKNKRTIKSTLDIIVEFIKNNKFDIEVFRQK